MTTGHPGRQKLAAASRGARRIGLLIGRRGTALLFFALLDVVYAVGLARPPEETRRSPTLMFIAHVAPLEVWAAIWTLVGLVCLAGAFSRTDRWAFTAAATLKVFWGGTFLLGWLIVGLDRGWLSAVIWLAMAGWISVIASWPEPPITEGS